MKNKIAFKTLGLIERTLAALLEDVREFRTLLNLYSLSLDREYHEESVVVVDTEQISDRHV